MSVKIKVSPHSTLRHCTDCNSHHLGAPCGLSYAERLNSQSVDSAWMPGKNVDRKNYLDTQAFNDTFGENARERMMDETHGFGYDPSPEQVRSVLDDD